MIVSERVVAEIEELSKERGTSVSATCSWIVEQYLYERNKQGNPSSRPEEGTYELKKGEPKPDDTDYAKLMTLFKAAKDSGII